MIETKASEKEYAARFLEERPDPKDHEKLVNLNGDLLAVESKLFSHYDQIKVFRKF